MNRIVLIRQLKEMAIESRLRGNLCPRNLYPLSKGLDSLLLPEDLCNVELEMVWSLCNGTAYVECFREFAYN